MIHILSWKSTTSTPALCLRAPFSEAATWTKRYTQSAPLVPWCNATQSIQCKRNTLSYRFIVPQADEQRHYASRCCGLTVAAKTGGEFWKHFTIITRNAVGDLPELSTVIPQGKFESNETRSLGTWGTKRVESFDLIPDYMNEKKTAPLRELKSRVQWVVPVQRYPAFWL